MEAKQERLSLQPARFRYESNKRDSREESSHSSSPCCQPLAMLCLSRQASAAKECCSRAQLFRAMQIKNTVSLRWEAPMAQEKPASPALATSCSSSPTPSATNSHSVRIRHCSAPTSSLFPAIFDSWSTREQANKAWQGALLQYLHHLWVHHTAKCFFVSRATQPTVLKAMH